MHLKTRLRSMGMRYFSSVGYLEKQRAKGRKRRDKQGAPPTVHYFHQVDDPYSHLAVQKLDQLTARYRLSFQPHLVCAPGAEYQGSAEHFKRWALQDVLSVATDYGTQFPNTNELPTTPAIAQANAQMASHLDQSDFAAIAMETGTALWAGHLQSSTNDVAAGEHAVVAGTQLRKALGHYQGAMFYFEGEWFWGIDRMRLLEQRLIAEGFDTQGGPLCVPEPAPIPCPEHGAKDVLLEYFPSLRSPYTAIGHRRVLDLIAATGVTVAVRPVMPMLMRGIPAPRAKQQYIITDAGREGRVHNAPLGQIVDPFGEPVKRAFALFPAADAAGSAMEFITAYLQAAWFDGEDITKEVGLMHVAQSAGLDWRALQQHSQNADWEAILANNLKALTEQNLWGVPSFRVSGGNASDSYACWGQDRIWRVANEIARRT